MKKLDIRTADEILEQGLALQGFEKERQLKHCLDSKIRTFRSLYGAHPLVYAHLWELLQTTSNPDARVYVPEKGKKKEKMFKYFMMTLHHFKVNNVVDVAALSWKVSVRTYVKAVADLSGA